ncbi:hypothetical protein BO83DRAFT_125408 [Aspergillus eucalypticola CBS 122712]|uniref:Uncharacterized protein n=1 Tax=Aspergillus eucalypticola (strain CBS 122712 / IBT 29274) TaxID=1448314 RepID=A0A317UUS2_ASPEC|nr:uncharacterized protein BO83DRAFT_125408 [Aspergillus eucalypticola CBS 122712]PWY64828.1 hypothetical protein BO83DRAFT_125408 [Aspergillus eucalypticola CBS 122712]
MGSQCKSFNREVKRRICKTIRRITATSLSVDLLMRFTCFSRFALFPSGWEQGSRGFPLHIEGRNQLYVERSSSQLTRVIVAFRLRNHSQVPPGAGGRVLSERDIHGMAKSLPASLGQAGEMPGPHPKLPNLCAVLLGKFTGSVAAS